VDLDVWATRGSTRSSDTRYGQPGDSCQKTHETSIRVMESKRSGAHRTGLVTLIEDVSIDRDCKISPTFFRLILQVLQAPEAP
jgi:hypothetical protein